MDLKRWVAFKKVSRKRHFVRTFAGGSNSTPVSQLPRCGRTRGDQRWDGDKAIQIQIPIRSGSCRLITMVFSFDPTLAIQIQIPTRSGLCRLITLVFSFDPTLAIRIQIPITSGLCRSVTLVFQFESEFDISLPSRESVLIISYNSDLKWSRSSQIHD